MEIKPLIELAETEAFEPKDISEFSPSFKQESVTNDIFDKHKRKAWLANQTDIARCDFSEGKATVSLRNGGIRVLSLWRKSRHGRTLLEIKEDLDMVPFFAEHMARFIQSVMGQHIDPDIFAIITTPKRRHKVNNFATLVARRIAEIIGITFYEDVAVAKSHLRVNAVFEINNMPRHRNLIVFDDFITSGQTIFSMHKLLETKNFNCIYFAAVLNRL